MPQYRAKQLKILATTSPERLNDLPEIPTLKEKGFDFVRFGWLGVCAGSGTPEPIIKTLNEHIVADRGDAGISGADRECRLDRRFRPRRRNFAAVIQKTLDDVAPAIQEFGLQQDQ